MIVKANIHLEWEKVQQDIRFVELANSTVIRKQNKQKKKTHAGKARVSWSHWPNLPTLRNPAVLIAVSLRWLLALYRLLWICLPRRNWSSLRGSELCYSPRCRGRGRTQEAPVVCDMWTTRLVFYDRYLLISIIITATRGVLASSSF